MAFNSGKDKRFVTRERRENEDGSGKIKRQNIMMKLVSLHFPPPPSSP